MHEKKRIAILKLLEDTDIKDADKIYFCVLCQNVVQRPNFCQSNVDGYDFLVLCNPCKTTIDEENDRKKEIERLQRNKIRLQQMMNYIRLDNSWPEARAAKYRN